MLLTLLAITGCNYREEKGRHPFSGAAVGFAEVRDQVFTPNCLGCHGGNHPPTLITFEQVKANLGKIQDAVLVKKSMICEKRREETTCGHEAPGSFHREMAT